MIRLTPLTASIWFPLFDTPLTLTMSREQLQCVQDALLGRPEPVPGWNAHFASELERVLRETVEGSPDSGAGS